MKYKVMVGNIGMVHDGNNKAEAIKDYNEYVRQSKGKPCRAHQEDVFLLVDDEPEKTFRYSDYKEERLQTNIDIQQEKLDRAKELLSEYREKLANE